MALETASYVANLVATNPDGGDARSTADDHLRLIKASLKRTFPLLDAAVSVSAAQIMYVNDVSASIQLQLNQLRDGSATANAAINARYANSASFAALAAQATLALTANSASFATLAGQATLALTANSASYAVLAGTATTAATANSASFAVLAGTANFAASASDAQALGGISAGAYAQLSIGFFTATITGMNTVVTGTLYYRITGKKVTVHTGGSYITGTSNSGAMQIQGIPPEIRPTLSQNAFTLFFENGLARGGFVYIQGNQPNWLCALGVDSGAFNSSAVSKGLNNNFCVSYDLT